MATNATPTLPASVFEDNARLRTPKYTVFIAPAFRYWLDRRGMTCAQLAERIGAIQASISVNLLSQDPTKGRATLFKFHRIVAGFNLTEQEFLAPFPDLLKEFETAVENVKAFLESESPAPVAPEPPAPAITEPPAPVATQDQDDDPEEDMTGDIYITTPYAYHRLVDNEKIRDVVAYYLFHIRSDHTGGSRTVRCQKCLTLEEKVQKLFDRDSRLRNQG